MGFDRFSGGAGSGRYIRVTGGVLDAYGGKDGLDANGDIFLDGGAVSVSSQSQGMDGAVDMDGQFVVTGGTLITAGSAQSPASSSSQTTILISYDSQQASGSVITLKDANGETVAEYTSRIAFTASCITSPKLEQGQTYTLFIDGVKRTDITISSLVTTTSDSGGSYSGGGMGGMGGRGGGRR
ncbi:MAG: hypothetical protein LBD16_08705 [Oscillospiraceae bacterium]|jgi:hypothetical protein|nr:hypothetical protein [Oscillospiraceae bacterium]